MKRLATLFFISMTLASPNAEAKTFCEEYKDRSEEPRLMNGSQFKQTEFGTLAIRSSRDRYLAFTSTGCFDLSKSKMSGKIHFFLNSINQTKNVRYFRAAVTRHYPGGLAGEPNLALQFFRNIPSKKSQSGWWKAIEDEELYSAGSTILGEKFDVTRRGYISKNSLDVKALGGYSKIDVAKIPSIDGDWHALVGNHNQVPRSSSRYRVEGNTRDPINDILKYVPKLSDREGTVVTKIYLNKFDTSSDIRLRKPMLKIPRAVCVYIDYRISDDVEIPISVSDQVNILVLRFDSKAQC